MRNRFLEKKRLGAGGLPTTDFRLARNHRELVGAHRALGFPGVLKLQFPDGDAGPWVVRDFDDVPRVLRETKGRPLVWERYVEVDRVISAAANRSSDGTVTVSPSGADSEVRALTAQLGERLGIIGGFIVTFFHTTDGRLLASSFDVQGDLREVFDAGLVIDPV
jgi:phosphoribosylaminoimidazole carboxylase (NCAIR synthetase)